MKNRKLVRAPTTSELAGMQKAKSAKLSAAWDKVSAHLSANKNLSLTNWQKTAIAKGQRWGAKAQKDELDHLLKSLFRLADQNYEIEKMRYEKQKK